MRSDGGIDQPSTGSAASSASSKHDGTEADAGTIGSGSKAAAIGAGFPGGQTLLFDADDTLWENNIYFERAIAAFITCLDHREHSRQEVRAALNKVEHETIAAHGYGLGSFRKSLATCFERLSDGPPDEARHTQIVKFADAIADAEIELLPGVAETLPALATRHRVVMVTKGNEGEQRDKLHRSGIAEYFAAVEVLAEKDAGSYRSLVSRHRLDPARTWMIGNSPRSDINPALEAGLHAVFIPHHHTWVLEHETLKQSPAGQYLLELTSFAELSKIF